MRTALPGVNRAPFKFDFSLFRLWSDRGGAPLA
jgi:hypothetical protein